MLHGLSIPSSMTSSNIWLKVQIVELLGMRFSAASCNFQLSQYSVWQQTGPPSDQDSILAEAKDFSSSPCVHTSS
jgi:hypothetical protein